MTSSKIKCLVTGGAGFIGSHIVDRLVKLKYDVVVVDDLSAPENEKFYFNDDAAYHELSIHDDDCSSIFEHVDYVFHLAARSRIQPTIGSPGECFETNVVGTQRVLDWSRRAGVKRVVYSGTSSLYGHQNKIPFTPNMPSDCLNPYSMSKWMGERVCELYSQLYGLDSIVLRYFNVYGPREPVKGTYAPVIGLFKRQRDAKEKLTVVGDGEQRRDFTYIDDVVDANMRAMLFYRYPDNAGFEVYNVGSGKNYSINEIAELVSGEVTHIAERPAEVRETLADISKTVDELDWYPKCELVDKINSY
jgi:UDP-glucose 4-epimerase